MNFFNIKDKILDLSTPIVMGILNITEDSFYDGGNFLTDEKALEKVKKMLKEGARIIDIGAQSTKPGSRPIKKELEKERLLDKIRLIKNNFPDTIISIDTFHADIASSCILNGADIINDISSGEIDNSMLKTIAKLNVPYIAMHMQGRPNNMQNNPKYNNVVDDILIYFKNKITKIRGYGIENIIIDPGFGFGKTIDHNYEILNNLDRFQEFNLPVLAGISRKSMIYNVLDTTSEYALNGTIAANSIAISKGAKILRVHDVKEAIECIKIVNFINK
tara:strand:- start:32593 stop:33420 length:828 start_codon:yes stop_codon:yes gene_type:complete